MQEKKLTTLLEIIKYSANLLSDKGIKDSRLNVELMFCDILKCDRIKLYLDFDKPLQQDEITIFKKMLKRRMLKEPLQYILGKTNFYGYDIILNSKVLIPRQETEILVEKIINDILSSSHEFIRILEIGSGSGCIAVALSGELSKKNIKHRILSIDISEEAIDIARQNADRNNIELSNLEFRKFDFLKESITDIFDYVVSNPPYIPEKDIQSLDDEVRLYEPVNALSDGGEGTAFYSKIFSELADKSRIFLEIGDGRRKYIEDELKKHNIKDYNFCKDYCNIDRVLIIK
ncbi:MAG: peptide chain release factor N(5)-glutamine methyltransferase [Ignavibacteriae bacterium]|nr:peptide chain release factor N(5)-glutamine methyltransferase [Ignavibacteriota bacterium]